MSESGVRAGVLVIGGGHAGIEAAHAAVRAGARVTLVTGRLDTIGAMPCNPSIGGPAKGHLVAEIDALGGLMPRVTDLAAIQVRRLNTGKGPAVQALRAQVDKDLYATTMQRWLADTDGLDLVAGMVEDLRRVPGGWEAILADGRTLAAAAVVVTTGTFLGGRLVAGERITPGGRAGEAPAAGLSRTLARLGFRLVRLKTGTPPRIDAGSIDFEQTTIQPGSDEPLWFSRWWTDQHRPNGPWPVPLGVYPAPDPSAWRPQMACYQVFTTPATHQVIRENLHRAPMFTGVIEGTGPRYCPSIEDKIVRFAGKESHGLFLEPEGWRTTSVYLQGANTSLPEDVQDAFVRSIPGLKQARILRYGYAVEYDAVTGTDLTPWLEARAWPGLFLAGQVCGTSGYEEAAGQGVVAGLNAARAVLGGAPVEFPRQASYLGVMLDDLTSTARDEPYRLHTSRAEARLALRASNADLRLGPVAEEAGLIDVRQAAQVQARSAQIQAWLASLARRGVTAADRAWLEGKGFPAPGQGVTAAEYLARPDVPVGAAMGFGVADPDIAAEVAVDLRYRGYLEREERRTARLGRMADVVIPLDFDPAAWPGLRTEARQSLVRHRPRTLGQAARLPGVTPADAQLLVVAVTRSGAAARG